MQFGCPLVVCWFSLENAYCNDPIKSETLVLSVSQKVLLSPAPPKSSNWPPFCVIHLLASSNSIQLPIEEKRTTNCIYLDSLSRLILTWWFGVTIVLQALGIRNRHPSTHTMDSWEFQSLQFQKSRREVPRRKRKNEASHLLLSCPTRQPRCREGDQREAIQVFKVKF